jgi:signal transduction histidine kinase
MHSKNDPFLCLESLIDQIESSVADQFRETLAHAKAHAQLEQQRRERLSKAHAEALTTTLILTTSTPEEVRKLARAQAEAIVHSTEIIDELEQTKLQLQEAHSREEQAGKAAERNREELAESNARLEEQSVLAKQMTERAESETIAKSEVLAKMSREIRTPISGIIDQTGLLLNTDLNEEQQGYVETVKSTADALLGLIKDILDFSKIESGKLEMETIDFDLLKLLDNFAEMMALTAQKKGLEFLCAASPETPTLLQGDPGRLRQVFLNLTSNAIKFTESGEVSISVELESQTDEDALLRFAVRDTGLGIPHDKQGALFDQFTQADSSQPRKFGGTGIGLAISKQLTEMMGGEIGVNSEPGRGSEFWITARFKKQPESKGYQKPDCGGLKGVKILVVDDNATNRAFLLRQLISWGAQPDEVPDGAAGLCRLQEAAQAGDPTGWPFSTWKCRTWVEWISARLSRGTYRLPILRWYC